MSSSPPSAKVAWAKCGRPAIQRLGQDVAIKVSAQKFTDRFEREARAIGALNHTNICTLYLAGPNYLVLEYIEGPTLAERTKEGLIPLEEAPGYVKQIADALEAAHDKSIANTSARITSSWSTSRLPLWQSVLEKGQFRSKKLSQLQITGALEAVHEKNIVHCDLKPANVKITGMDR